MLKNLHMCVIDIMPKNNLELHVLKPKPNLLPSCSQNCNTCIRKQWSEEPETAAVSELRKEPLQIFKGGTLMVI